MKSASLYNFLKNTAILLIPRRWIERYRAPLRRTAFLAYRGTTHTCNICAARLRTFVGSDRLCPRCGSLARTRRLWILLRPELERRPTASLLHLSPPAALADRIDADFPDLTYHRSDYVGEFAAEKSLDLRATGLPDDHYDLCVCYHVLEHIPEDKTAIRELYRILKPGGKAWIQTPFHAVEGPAREDDALVTPAERLQHFGQEDHVRIYSVASLRERLEEAGFRVDVLHFTSEDPDTFGLKPTEQLLFLQK